MKLVVNGSAVQRSSRGVQRYYDNIARHLSWPGGLDMSPVHKSSTFNRVSELLYRGRSDAIFWSPAQRGPLNALHHVVTVHDCINVEYTYVNDWRLPALRWATQRLLSSAEHVVAISQATKAAILRNYRIRPSSLVVIPSSCDVEIPADEQAVDAPGAAHTEPPFVLLVTNSLPHKNTIRACQAFVKSRACVEKIVLRVVGSLPPEAATLCQAGGVSLEIAAAVSNATLVAWYRTARFLLAPSLDEGHDLPVAEALARGCNVLCSDIAAHREFYGDLVKYFDPSDTEAITAAIDQALSLDGRWSKAPLPMRSFGDVAADYMSLFSSIESKTSRQPAATPIPQKPSTSRHYD